MTQDVRQWLAEIKNLQQKIVEIGQERDEAYAGAANWRKLYEREAQQRRTDATLAEQTIASLKAELEELHNVPPLHQQGGRDGDTLQHQVEQLNGNELKQKLVEVLLDCDRLSQALKAEQENHAQTRDSLTIALGDTVDLLTKERATRNQAESSSVISTGGDNGGAAITALEEAKTPLLELPPLNPVQFRA